MYVIPTNSVENFISDVGLGRSMSLNKSTRRPARNDFFSKTEKRPQKIKKNEMRVCDVTEYGMSLGDKKIVTISKCKKTTHVTNGKRKIENGKRKIENGKRKIENGKRKIENGKRKIENGKRKIENGKRKIENGKRKNKRRISNGIRVVGKISIVGRALIALLLGYVVSKSYA